VTSPPESIFVSQLPIRLGQFLKLASLVQDGGEARVKIEQGEVRVNNLVEKRRGRKLVTGDTVTFLGKTWLVAEGA
jgi:ribosome-associated protein